MDHTPATPWKEHSDDHDHPNHPRPQPMATRTPNSPKHEIFTALVLGGFSRAQRAAIQFQSAHPDVEVEVEVTDNLDEFVEADPAFLPDLLLILDGGISVVAPMGAT
jgi:hypothetical protein